MSDELNKIYTIKAGGLLPDIELEFLDREGQPLNLTGYTGTIRIAPCVGGRPIVAAGTITLTDAVNGLAKYVWNAGETDKPGEYLAECWFIRISDGKPMPLPGAGYGQVVITPRL